MERLILPLLGLEMIIDNSIVVLIMLADTDLGLNVAATIAGDNEIIGPLITLISNPSSIYNQSC